MWSGINSNVLRKKMDILKTNEKYEYNLIYNYASSNHKFYELKDHGNYKYLLDIEGVGYSGRFPYLALTGSCVILLENTDHNRNFKLFYDEYFQENIHYIKVKYDSSTSIEEINEKIIEKIEAHDCKKIAETCQKKATEYFTKETIVSYMASILNYYSNHYVVSNLRLNNTLLSTVQYISDSIKKRLINKYK